MKSLERYQDWHHCITALRDPIDHTTQKFVKVWGEPHRLRVITWFEQAQRGLGGTDTAAPPSEHPS